ncbi:hypothetical protein EVB91_026 [Rhizobium phage RHph_I1_18]|nr:hypothetical protein EVB91_026 [Rhizobium phage RHph_I1_18]
MKDFLKIFKWSPILMVKWPAYTFLSCVAVLLSWILAPFLAAYSVVKRVDVLPGVLQYFSTIDDTLDGGQHQVGYKTGVKGFVLWWQRTCWIFRNPAHGWQSVYLGYKDERATVLWSRVDQTTKVWMHAAADQKRYFTYKRDIPLFGDWYLKLWIGWSDRSYDGKYRHLLFQPFIPKKR